MSAVGTRPTSADVYRFRLPDLWWLLATPLYLLVSTARHEGATIRRFVFWPSFFQERFYWGYVVWDGAPSWSSIAAPYFLLTLSLLWILWPRRTLLDG